LSFSHIALILLSSVFHSLWNILTQTSRNSNFLSGLKGALIMIAGVPFLVLFGDGDFPPEIVVWVIASGILHGVYILSLSKAYDTQDISYVYPIARSAPVFVPLFAWVFLEEKISAVSLSAIGLILLAVYILHFKGHLIRGFRDLWDAVLHRDLRWAFITLGLVVAYSIVDKQGMSIYFAARPDQPLANGLSFFFMEAMIGFSVCNIYLFWRFPAKDILDSWKAELGKGAIAGMATVGSYGLICVVLQFEPVSQVVAVRQVSVLMVVCWGVWKLGEPFGRQRLLAAALIIAGVGLMAVNS